jgi:hypothetical protein
MDSDPSLPAISTSPIPSKKELRRIQMEKIILAASSSKGVSHQLIH